MTRGQYNFIMEYFFFTEGSDILHRNCKSALVFLRGWGEGYIECRKTSLFQQWVIVTLFGPLNTLMGLYLQFNITKRK